VKPEIPKLPRFRVTFKGRDTEKSYVIETQDEPTAYLWGEKQIKYWCKCFNAGKDLSFDENPRKLSVHVNIVCS
jgi:hypothetical protein